MSRKWVIVERNGRKFGSQSTTMHIHRVLLMPDSLSLVWGHSVHFVNFPILQLLKLCSSPNFYLISSKRYTRYPNHGAIQAIIYLAICQKLQKLWYKLWYFEFFLKTGPYTAGNFKVLFLPQFSLESIQTL